MMYMAGRLLKSLCHRAGLSLLVFCCMYEEISDNISRISLPLTCTGMRHPLVRCYPPRTPPPHHSPKCFTSHTFPSMSTPEGLSNQQLTSHTSPFMSTLLSPKASGFLEQLPIHLLVKSPPRSTTLDTSRKLHLW